MTLLSDFWLRLRRVLYRALYIHIILRLLGSIVFWFGSSCLSLDEYIDIALSGWPLHKSVDYWRCCFWLFLLQYFRSVFQVLSMPLRLHPPIHIWVCSLHCVSFEPRSILYWFFWGVLCGLLFLHEFDLLKCLFQFSAKTRVHDLSGRSCPGPLVVGAVLRFQFHWHRVVVDSYV